MTTSNCAECSAMPPLLMTEGQLPCGVWPTMSRVICGYQTQLVSGAIYQCRGGHHGSREARLGCTAYPAEIELRHETIRAVEWHACCIEMAGHDDRRAVPGLRVALQ